MTKLPNNIEAEAYLIGSLLISSDESLCNYGKCAALGITDHSFFHPNHQIMWCEITKLFNKGNPFDLVVLSEQMQLDGVLERIGGVATLSDFSRYSETSTLLEKYAKIVRENELRRELMRVAMTVGERATKTENVSEVIEYIEREICKLGSASLSDKTKTMGQIASENKDEMERILNGQPLAKGLMTGFPSFDGITNGLQNRSMVVVAARPSVGKTSIVMNFTENIISKMQGKRILFFSLEMDGMAILRRMISSVSGVPISRIQDGLVSESQKADIKRASDFLCGNDFLLVNDSSDMTISQLRATARHKAMRQKIDLVIVDYLQFISSPGQTKDIQTSEISRNLKAMAKELGCPVLVLSQLNRDSEKTQRRPQLSDLRDSGAIEQDADVVAFLWPNPDKPIVELLVSKNRNGATGKIDLHFEPSLTKFTETSHCKE